MIKSKIDAIDRNIDIVFPDTFSDKARSRYLAEYAATALEEARGQNRRAIGADTPYETFVDGRQDAPLNSVKPDGKIIFQFELHNEIFAWIDGQLRKHSPVGPGGRPGHPGLYKRSHIFTADGVLVEPGTVPPNAKEYVFVNIQPYARKIERGLSPQAPGGVYMVVAGLAQARWSNIAIVKFSYRTPITGAIHEWAATTKMFSKSRGRDRAEWLRRQPAIVINLR